MANLELLEKVIELVRRHGIYQVEIEEGGVKLSVTASAPHSGVVSGFSPAMANMAGAYAPMPGGYGQAAPAPAAPPMGAAPAEASKPVAKGRLIRSPFVGTFYRSSSPGSDPFTDIGKRVKKGDALCIIEAMKLMNEIEAEFDGVIKEILVDNEQPVEFDQPLFVVE